LCFNVLRALTHRSVSYFTVKGLSCFAHRDLSRNKGLPDRIFTETESFHEKVRLFFDLKTKQTQNLH